MLDNELVKKIEGFVYSKPRSVQEVSSFINKNWRTADRYIEEIEREFGTISTRVFREGTRGALKIAFWSSIDKISSSAFQEKLEEEIMRARWKEDFSVFDIFQFVPEKAKKVSLETEKSEERAAYTRISNIYNKVQKQLLIFSGNLSFIRFKDKKTGKSMLDTLDSLVKKGISIKVLCRVDIAGRKNVESVLALNYKNGREMVEIRHRHHPLRATIVDRQFFDMKETKEPTGNIHELDKKIFIFYNIKDREWVDWATRIFWKMFNSSIDAKKRLQELQRLK
jgi:hypothetical protein